MTEERTEENVRKMIGAGNDAWVMPVSITAEAGQRVLNFDYVKGVLERAGRIAVADCDCRMQMRKCDHTLEGCFFLGPWYEKFVASGWARPATAEEALAILERTYEDGLVLIMAEADEGPYKICSCCSCCCFLLEGLQKYGMENALLASDFVARHDAELCTDCGTCVSRCHFDAASRGEGRVEFDAAKCFGCGLCVGTCPGGAQTLTRR
jgi:ferredoxin